MKISKVVNKEYTEGYDDGWKDAKKFCIKKYKKEHLQMLRYIQEDIENAKDSLEQFIEQFEKDVEEMRA